MDHAAECRLREMFEESTEGVETAIDVVSEGHEALCSLLKSFYGRKHERNDILYNVFLSE